MDPLQPIYRRLTEVYGLPPRLAQAVTREVADAFHQTVDEFVSERHETLRRAGLDNRAIYAALTEELALRRFRAPALSERQLRRKIYG